MPLTRITHFATAADVDTVLVDGRVVMEGRQVRTLEPGAVMEAAGVELAKALERTGLTALTEEPAGMWGATRFAGTGAGT